MNEAKLFWMRNVSIDITHKSRPSTFDSEGGGTGEGTGEGPSVEDRMQQLEDRYAAAQANFEKKEEDLNKQIDFANKQVKEANETIEDIERDRATSLDAVKRNERGERFERLVSDGKALPADRSRILLFSEAIGRAKGDFPYRVQFSERIKEQMHSFNLNVETLSQAMGGGAHGSKAVVESIINNTREHVPDTIIKSLADALHMNYSALKSLYDAEPLTSPVIEDMFWNFVAESQKHNLFEEFETDRRGNEEDADAVRQNYSKRMIELANNTRPEATEGA